MWAEQNRRSSKVGWAFQPNKNGRKSESFFHASRSKAFTLAEILITLGIIGIVAAMTLPSVINKIEESVFTNQYKKLYSTLANAVNKANSDQNFIVTSISAGSWSANFGALDTNLNIVKTCTSAELCWTQDTVLGLNGVDINAYDWNFDDAKARNAKILADGAVISGLFITGSTGSKAYLQFYVDLNGKKGPNRLGRDIHVMAFVDSPTTEPKLIPYYSASRSFTDTYSQATVTGGCSGLGVTGAGNRGYTCGAKWMTGD